MKQIVALSLGLLFSFNAYAQSSGAVKPTKKEEKPAAKTAEPDPFMPSASDIRDEEAQKDPDAEIQELKDKRWVPQGEISKPQDPASKSGSISVTQTCTNKNGVEYKSTEAGYDGCLNEMSMQKLNQPESDSGEKDKSKTGVGVQYKFGK